MLKYLLVLIFINTVTSRGFTISDPDSSVDIRRLIATGAVITVADIGLWSYYNKAWYSGNTTKMHSTDDWYNYNLNIDKIGHLHGAISLSRFSYYWLKWVNLSEKEALRYSSLAAWLLQLQVEIYDSQYEEYGFSWGDIGANTVGVLYPLLQYHLPFLKNVNVKVSYFPSSSYYKGHYKHLIDDYEGRTYWFTFHPYDILPVGVQKVYPEWLGLALGYGGTDIIKPGGGINQDKNKKGTGTQEWYLSLDVDLIKLFKPDKRTFLYSFLDLLNLIHLPLPAFRFSPDGEVVFWQ